MFNKKLKELRKSKNLTQSELSEYIFVSRSTIAKWENGYGFPSEANIETLCKYFDITENFLLDNEDKQQILNIKKARKNNIIISIFGLIIPFLMLVLSFIKVYQYNYNHTSNPRPMLLYFPKSIVNVAGVHIIYSFIIYFSSIIFSILNLNNVVVFKTKKVTLINFLLIIFSIIAFVVTFTISTIVEYNSNWIIKF